MTRSPTNAGDRYAVITRVWLCLMSHVFLSAPARYPSEKHVHVTVGRHPGAKGFACITEPANEVLDKDGRSAFGAAMTFVDLVGDAGAEAAIARARESALGPEADGDDLAKLLGFGVEGGPTS